MMELAGYTRFSAQEGTAFRTLLDGAEVGLTLKEVQEQGSDPAFEQFSLFFQGPQEPLLPQGTYRLEHEALGSQDIFLTAIARHPGGHTYQAVFNRFREPRP